MTPKGENYSVKMQKYYFCTTTHASVGQDLHRWNFNLLLSGVSEHNSELVITAIGQPLPKNPPAFHCIK